jgi:eukaryotic-like serine/threonine-protein kinase
MALASGARLGSYEILSALGAGGMGEVYRARDTKLGRNIALKILPDTFANDPDRLARFQREAQVLASLNHPHIAAIYGLEDAAGIKAFVMELVEGEDLAQRIARGPMPLDEVLPIAKQIAEALEAAHEQGIIHRDLKPANIKVRPDGTVKVLDFGLAKLTEAGGAGGAGKAGGAGGDFLTQSPTITTPAMMTGIGVILGTAAYMSPEQARGKPLDRRTDIWSFGCVLCEMLTGLRTFAGNEVSDVLASVLAREADLKSLPATTPPPILRLLRRCLQKDRGERLRDIGDARIEIQEAMAASGLEGTGASASGADRRRERAVLISALALVTLIAAFAIVRAFRPTVPPSEMRLEINTPPTTDPESLALSPDGRKIVFVADSEGRQLLLLRALDSVAVRPLTGTDGAQYPFWSPDSRSVGFTAEGKLKRIDIDGGAVRTLANESGGTGGAWNRDGLILFAMLGNPIFRVSDTGGGRVAVTQLDNQQGSHFTPRFLPDGRQFLYWVRGNSETGGVYAGRLGSTQSRRLLDADPSAVYSSGHLLFMRQGALFAQSFDPVRLELSGNPFSVAEHVGNGQDTGMSVSDAGSIAYRTRSSHIQRQFVWFDRSGQEIRKVGDALSTGLASPSLSSDGQHVVLYRAMNSNTDVWLFETKRGVLSRFTSDVADDVVPIWSPDGGSIVFSSNRQGIHDLYQKSATAGGSEELLLSTAQPKFATDWSPDGRFLLFNSVDSKKGTDIWALRLDGNRKPFQIVQTDSEELNGQFSPDGNWLAYQSNESGRNEIYVQPFPGPGNKWPVSTSGGSQVRWRRDGRELFYVSLDGRLMAVPIQIGPSGATPQVGTPAMLFAPHLGGAVQRADYRHQYMVSPDGQRFLVATVTEGANSPITVIVNWTPGPRQ